MDDNDFVMDALFAEVKRQAAEIETLRSELYPAKEIEEQRAKRWEAEKRLLQKTCEQLAAVTAERDAARYDFAEYVECGSNDVSPYCKNACPYCVDKNGHCKPHKCRGFAYGPQEGENDD